MVRLVERELQVDRRAVERDVAIRRARDSHHADRSHAEVRLHPVLGESRAVHAHLDLVEEGIVERPAPSLGQWDVEVRRPRPARDRMGHDRSTRAIREGEPQGEGTRLRYANCPQAPFNDGTQQNACAGI